MGAAGGSGIRERNRTRLPGAASELTVRARPLIGLVLLGAVLAIAAARADDTEPSPSSEGTLVKQANAPISSILQLRLQNGWVPRFSGVDGQGNTLTLGVTMPLPEYRFLPVPQLSLLTVPTAVTLPGGTTSFGDVRFVDVAVFRLRPDVLWGVGPSFVFPTATADLAGQGKWQLGPAAVVAWIRPKWLLGVLAQNPISFAGETKRADANALVLQPFASYQLGGGWFIRSQPLMVLDWKSDRRLVPLDLGIGRVFKIGRQDVSCFIEPSGNIRRDGVVPEYGIGFGVTLLYPNFWGSH
jgi:hypothetical protein